MKPIFKPLVKLFVCTLIFMAIYPVVALANGFLQISGTAIYTIVFVFVGIAVFFLRDTLINRSAHRFATFFAPIFLIAAATILMCIYHINASTSTLLTYTAITLLIGIFAFFIAGSEPVDLLSIATLGWITAIDLIAVLIIMNFSFSFVGWIALLDYFLLCSMQFILINQENLERQTTSRHYSFAALPKKIRSYNFLLIARLLAIISVAFLLFRNFNSILTWLFDKISALVKYIIGLILKLFSSNGDSQQEIINNSQPLEKPMLPENEATSSWLWDILYYIFMFILFCGLVALIVYVIYRISKWKIPQKLKEVTSEYTDSEQILESKRRKSHKLADNRRRWNRDYSAYRKMKDTEEKFHAGYSLAIRGLMLHGLPILHSDTTCEIDSKATKTLQEQAYHAATNDYNIMVYGENGYSQEALQSLDKALVEIAELKK